MRKKPIILAGRLERLFANLIDSLLLLIPSSLLAGGASDYGALSVLGTFACSITYYVYFTSSSWQATPGKRLLNIYVVKSSGQSLTQRDALERFLAYILPSLPMYASVIPNDVAPIFTLWLSLIWFAPILFSDLRIGMHDRLCSTRVVVGKADIQ